MTKNMKLIDNKIYLGKYALEKLAKEYQTPLMIYDKVDLQYNIDILKGFFKSEDFISQIVYASKALLIPKIVQIMAQNDLWIDAVSGGDLYIIERSGFSLSRVIFHGNNKSIDELTKAILKGVGIIVVDNIEELKKIINLASYYQKQVQTMFRVNPGIEVQTHYYIQTSLLSSKFGESIFDFDRFDQIMQLYLNQSYVTLLGFHSHIGSQILDVKPFIVNAEKMINFTKYIVEKYHYPLYNLNLGGGFGIRYVDEEINIKILLKELSSTIAKTLKDVNSTIKTVAIEPGRLIVGPSGFTLYRADMIKTTYSGKKYLFIDGGMTDNIRPALYNAKYKVANVSHYQGLEKIKVDIVGKCCESGDIIARDIIIEEPRIGDYIIVYGTGAYCYAMGINYNSALRPAVLLVGNQIEVISRRQEEKDLYQLF